MAQLHLKVSRPSTGKVKLTTTEDKKKAASMEKLNLDALRGEIDEYIKL